MPDFQKLLIPGAILAAVYYFVKDERVRAGVLGVGATIVAKQIPYVSDVL